MQSWGQAKVIDRLVLQTRTVNIVLQSILLHKLGLTANRQKHALSLKIVETAWVMSRSAMVFAIFATVGKALRNNYLHAETLMLDSINVEER